MKDKISVIVFGFTYDILTESQQIKIDLIVETLTHYKYPT